MENNVCKSTNSGEAYYEVYYSILNGADLSAINKTLTIKNNGGFIIDAFWSNGSFSVELNGNDISATYAKDGWNGRYLYSYSISVRKNDVITITTTDNTLLCCLAVFVGNTSIQTQYANVIANNDSSQNLSGSVTATNRFLTGVVFQWAYNLNNNLTSSGGNETIILNDASAKIKILDCSETTGTFDFYASTTKGVFQGAIIHEF